MKRLILKIGTTLAIAAGMFWNVSAQAQTLSANMTTCTGSSPCLDWTDSIHGNPSIGVGGGYWRQTYSNNGGFGIGSFKLSHNSGILGYRYWGGFTSGSNGDTIRHSIPCTPSVNCDSTHSAPWVDNQWGVMARGGISSTSGSTATVVKGQPYLIAYWDYFNTDTGMSDMNNQSVKISLANNSTFTPQDVWICNHPWPYWGNFYGDGFASPLNQPGDHFDLIIHGVKSNGTEVQLPPITLAEYNASAPNKVSQSPNWRHILLTGLGTDIKSIYFTMYSTDQLVIGDTNYGPNTAVYFCMDKLTVIKSGSSPSKAVIQQVQKSAGVPLPPIEVTDYFPIASYTGGEVIVYDTSGKEVLKTTVGAGEKINLSMLPAGNYRLQHGHKVIPFNKK